jgi:hypothetical protein
VKQGTNGPTSTTSTCGERRRSPPEDETERDGDERVVREIENITRKPMVGFVGPEEDGRRQR